MSNRVNIKKSFTLKCPSDKRIKIGDIRVSDGGRCDGKKIAQSVVKTCQNKNTCKLSNEIVGCSYDVGVNYGCIDDIGKKLDGSNEMIQKIEKKQELNLDLISDGDQEDMQELKTTQSIKFSEEDASEDLDIVANQEMSGESTININDDSQTASEESADESVLAEEKTLFDKIWSYKNYVLGVSVFLLFVLAIYIVFSWYKKDDDDDLFLTADF